RGERVAIEAARAGVSHRAKNAVIGAAAAEMARQRRADLVSRWHSRSVAPTPAVVERRSFHDEARRAEAALQGVVRHESLLHRMQSGLTDPLTDAPDRRHRL